MVRAVWARLFWLAGVALVVLVGAATPAQAATTDVVTTWKIEDTGPPGWDPLRLPLVNSPDAQYDFEVAWGDGATSTVTSWNDPDATHTYASGGIKTVTISFPNDASKLIGWGGLPNSAEQAKLMTIEQWGGRMNLGNGGSYFIKASNLTSSATDSPDLTGTTNFRYFFLGASKFNGDITTWDTSDVTNMSGVFYDAAAFDRDISGWDVGNVETMESIFYSASSFNQDISGWATDKVKDMSFMFYNATAFNQDISSLTTDNVTNMSFMFRGASAFNQDVSAFETGLVSTMRFMFFAAASFNQDLSNWHVSNVGDMTGMFDGTAMSTRNYDKVLIGWSSQPSLQSSVELGAADTQYSCAAQASRDSLITTYGWLIVDDGLAPCVELSPAAVGLPVTLVGQTSDAIVTMTNVGGSDLTLPAGAVTLSGPDAGQFGVNADTCSGATVAGGGTCTVKVTFTPAAPGAKVASVSVTSNALTSPDTVALSGTAVAPVFSASPSAVDFGQVTIGTTGGPRVVTITNTGTATLAVGAVTTTGDAFATTANTCANVSIEPGATCTVAVSFAPVVKGSATGSLRFDSNASGRPHSVALTGTAVRAPVVPKKKQMLSAKLPKRIKLSGLTVITPANAPTNAGQLVRTRITGGPMKATSAGQVRYFKVVRGPKGKVSVRTFGQPNLRLNVTQTAPATSQYTPFRRGATYLRGLRG